MERVAFKLKMKQGMKEEYKKRHDKIWPEMTEVLNKAGIHNYTIWLTECNLFGYYETEDNEYAVRVQSESDVVQKWNRYMMDILESEVREDGRVVPIVENLGLMFLHK